MGDDVAVGEDGGVSNARVGMAVSVPGMKASAVRVTAAAMVCAIIVPCVSSSGADAFTVGKMQAMEAIHKTITDKRNGRGFNIIPPFGQESNIVPESTNSPLLDKRSPPDFVPVVLKPVTMAQETIIKRTVTGKTRLACVQSTDPLELSCLFCISSVQRGRLNRTDDSTS